MPAAAAQWRHDLESKAREAKETVRRTARAAERALGSPLQYAVVGRGPVYGEPLPQAPQVSSVEPGSSIFGYPGSLAWVRLVAEPGRGGSGGKEFEAWVPVRSQQQQPDGSRELILQAAWSRVRAKRLAADSLEATWPGLTEPRRPFRVEYAVEWRPAPGSSAEGGGSAAAPTGERRTVVRGLPAGGTEVQLRVLAHVGAPGEGEFKLTGPWLAALEGDQHKGTPPAIAEPTSNGQRGGGGAAAVEAAAAAAPSAGAAAGVGGAGGSEGAAQQPGWYVVEHEFIMLRAEPSRKGRACGTIPRGGRLHGHPFVIAGLPWLRLSPQPLEGAAGRRGVAEGESCWALVDATGTDIGLGVLMRRIEDGSGPPPGQDARWRVAHQRVVVRVEASTDAEILGFHAKGDIVVGAKVSVGGSDWLRTTWKAFESSSPREAWMLVDGASLGLGHLLVRAPESHAAATEEGGPGALRPPPSACKPVTRSTPPRPLTAAWLAAYGGLDEPPGEAWEELLPTSEDLGMSSQCSLVWIRLASSSASEHAYVAKRATEKGDLTSAEREYRFYTEVLGPDSTLRTRVSQLNGHLRVPRCQVANWKAGGGQERENFLLLLERLDQPAWTHVDPDVGLSLDQALAGATSLGHLHHAFAEDAEGSLFGHEGSLAWLPRTILDGQGAGMQHHFACVFQVNQRLLEDILPPGGLSAAERLMSGGLREIFERLAEPPLTLCHGDFRPENLRFGTGPSTAGTNGEDPLPAVAAFDWGLANRGRGLYDFAYFVMLCQTPEHRREREIEMLRRYLLAREGKEADDAAFAHAFEEVKTAALAVLAMVMVTRMHTKSAGFFQCTRDMLTRMLGWVGHAIADWNAYDAMTAYLGRIP